MLYLTHMKSSTRALRGANCACVQNMLPVSIATHVSEHSYVSSLTVFALQQQSGLEVTATWSTKPEQLTRGYFTEKFADSSSTQWKNRMCL